MPKEKERPAPRPDDFMVVTVALTFQGKLNPAVEDPPQFDTTEIEETFVAANAAEYLERVVSAIRERRLFGFMIQEAAESAVAAGDWVKKTTEDILAEAREEREKAKEKSPDILNGEKSST